jgi:hypothetical protein
MYERNNARTAQTPITFKMEVIKMNRNQKIPMAVIGVVVTTFAISAVTASPGTLNTPLYTFRMEEASSEMNFLPKEQSPLVYTTGEGYHLNTSAPKYCDNMEALPMTYYQCWHTFGNECWYTFDDGCWETFRGWRVYTLGDECMDKFCAITIGNTCDFFKTERHTCWFPECPL